MTKRRDHTSNSLDKGRFTCSWNTRDTDTYRLTCVGQTALDNLLRLCVVCGVIALDEGYGLRENGYVATQNTLHVLVGRERATLLALEIGVYYGLILNALRYIQGAVVVSIYILFFVVVYLCESHLI